MEITKSFLRNLTYQVNGAAIEVHKALGPGLLESVYHHCLKHELRLRGVNFVSEMWVPLNFKGCDFNPNLKCDLYVENCMVLELKSVAEFMPIHEAQLLTYMKLTKAPKGMLVNFNVVNLYHEGQKTFVNEYYQRLEES